jgi:hypothetical protein
MEVNCWAGQDSHGVVAPVKKKKKSTHLYFCYLAYGAGNNVVKSLYEGVSKSIRTGRLERELQMVQLSATRCSCIAILWVRPVMFCRHNPLRCFSTSVCCYRPIARPLRTRNADKHPCHERYSNTRFRCSSDTGHWDLSNILKSPATPPDSSFGPTFTCVRPPVHIRTTVINV